MTLENNLPICINHLRLVRQDYVSDCELKCRNCNNYDPNCQDYTPYTPQSNIPIRKGSLAYALSKK